MVTPCRLPRDAFGFVVTTAGIGELINEFLPVEDKAHIIARMKEMGKDIWQLIKESIWYQSLFARVQGDGSQLTGFPPELR